MSTYAATRTPHLGTLNPPKKGIDDIARGIFECENTDFRQASYNLDRLILQVTHLTVSYMQSDVSAQMNAASQIQGIVSGRNARVSTHGTSPSSPRRIASQVFIPAACILEGVLAIINLRPLGKNAAKDVSASGMQWA